MKEQYRILDSEHQDDLDKVSINEQESWAMHWRENLTPEDKEMLASCDLSGSQGSLNPETGNRGKIEGTISGHHVSLSYDLAAGHNSLVRDTDPRYFQGSIDGQAIPAEEAERLFKKYTNVAVYQSWEKLAKETNDERPEGDQRVPEQKPVWETL